MTSRPTHIDIATLRAHVNSMLDLFERQGVASVPLDADFYWSIPWGSEYALSAAPEPDVGSLADDIEFLGKDSDTPVAIMLCHAAPLLHYLGQRAGEHGVF
jgi:hypothetical protein